MNVVRRYAPLAALAADHCCWPRCAGLAGQHEAILRSAEGGAMHQYLRQSMDRHWTTWPGAPGNSRLPSKKRGRPFHGGARDGAAAPPQPPAKDLDAARARAPGRRPRR